MQSRGSRFPFIKCSTLQYSPQERDNHKIQCSSTEVRCGILLGQTGEMNAALLDAFFIM